MSKRRLPLVYVCSPYRNQDMMQQCMNIGFARMAAKDCVQRGEHPIVVHLHYTQFLDDELVADRKLGMEFGHDLLRTGIFNKVVLYTNRGISDGMKAEEQLATELGIPVEYRLL